MSTEFFNDQWRIPSNENQNKISNYSCEFDGTNYVQIISPHINNVALQPSEAELNANGYSVSAWVKIDSGFASTGGVFANDGIPQTGIAYGLEFFIFSTRAIGIRKGDGTGRFGADVRNAYTTETVPLNTWTHIAFVLPSASNTTWQIYINGVASTMTTSGSGGAVGYSNVYHGGIGRYRFEFFNGQIDQVSVFDYELSASQVSTLYGGGTAVTNPMSLSPKPISYYQLGEQSVDNGANYLVPNNSLSDYVFNFDGVNDYIDTPQINLGSTNTISFWINTTTTTQGTIFGDPNGYSDYALFSQPTLNRTSFRLGNNDSGYYQIEVSSGLLNDGNWHHHCLTRDGVTINYYIDGILQTNVINNTLNASAGTNTTIENIFAMPNGTFEYGGKLSNVALFNSALTSLQVQTIYNNGSPNDISSLSPVAWYKLNAADTFDGTDWTINDYGSGGNDGTSSNMYPSNLVVSDLQQTSGYSPYALDFDGINDYLDCGNDSSLQITGAMTISYWVKGTSTFGASGVGTLESSTSPGYLLGPSTTNTISFNIGLTSSSLFNVSTTQQITTTEWHHIVGVYKPSVSIKIYIDGQLSKTETSNIPSSQYAGGNDFRIGYRTCCQIDGQISNVAIWNTDLSSSEINEIFNEGVPSSLNNFSGTAPVSWWQLGSNSSFNTNWTCLDEIGTNNAVSVNMTNDDIVNGVGYSASGVGTSSIDIKGDAPYSTANGLSNSMDVLNRTTDIPS